MIFLSPILLILSIASFWLSFFAGEPPINAILFATWSGVCAILNFYLEWRR